MRENFDLEIKSNLTQDIIIDYGVIKGNDTVVFIKAGQAGSHYGYRNKYLKMAEMINKNYGSTVITSSNPYNGINPMDDAIKIINSIMNKNEYVIYYLGFSNGGIVGLQYATKYKNIKRIISVNAPLMINWHRTKDGIKEFSGEKLLMIYGEKDPSIRYVPLIENLENVETLILKNEDHHISVNPENFNKLPNYFFD